MEVVSAPTALLIHGWNDNATKGWFGWLGEKLRAAGYRVQAPHFSTEDRPLLPSWQAQLAAEAQHLDADSLIVAHSLGTFLTLRLLEQLPHSQTVGTVILISGFATAPDDRESKWFEPEPDWDAIRPRAHRFICIYSDDDHMVSPDRSRRLAHKLGAELLCMPGYGHFLRGQGLHEFPELLDLLEDRGLYKPSLNK